MNSGKKSTAIIVAILAIIVIGGILWAGKSPDNNGSNIPGSEQPDVTDQIAVSEVTKISNTLSEYQNAELGFSIKYPNVWEREEVNSGVNFVIPIDKDQVSTVATLQANVQVRSDNCNFPPFPIVKDRGTLKVGDDSLKTISVENTVKGREYYNRLYLLERGNICFMFSFYSIAFEPGSKNLTGSAATQAVNNNRAIVNSTEEAFVSMVKSFTLIKGPEGKDETKITPKN